VSGRDSSGGAAAAVVLFLVAFLLVAWVLARPAPAAVLAAGGDPPDGPGPGGGSGGGSGPNGSSAPSSGALSFLAYNQAQVSVLVGDSALLRPGDSFFLSTGNFGATPSVSDLNSWAGQIEAVDPGAIFVAHTGGLPNARALATGGLSPRFSELSLDLEPNEPGFDSSQASVDSVLDSLTQVAHAAGLRSVAYLSGQGIRSFHWSYAECQAHADLEVVETQGAEAVSSGNGPAAVEYLAGQYANGSLPVSTLSVQATVGSTANGDPVSLGDVLSTYNSSASLGLGPFFLEFTGSTASELYAVLETIR
jgi:hypothetical protein